MKDVSVAVAESEKSFATYKTNGKSANQPLAQCGTGTNRRSYLCNSANVFVPVRLREAQILVQPKAHIVAIKTVRVNANVEEVLLERRRDRRLARRRETSEPDRVSALSTQRLALGAAKGLVPGDVAVGIVSCVLVAEPGWRGWWRARGVVRTLPFFFWVRVLGGLVGFLRTVVMDEGPGGARLVWIN